MLVRRGPSDRFCIPSAQENAGFGEEHVHPLTLCPNSDEAMIAAFADKAWSSEPDSVSEALKAAREMKRSAMSGAQSAPSLKTGSESNVL